jgi:hypothetical protein
MMRDSPETIKMLRAQIAADARARADDMPAMVPFGHAGIDAALGGGLMRARLHEIFAASLDDGGSAAGFAAMLGAQLARPGATIFWLREQAAEARGGCLYAPGLAELGIDPGRVILGVIDDALGLLIDSGFPDRNANGRVNGRIARAAPLTARARRCRGGRSPPASRSGPRPHRRGPRPGAKYRPWR